MKLTNLLGAMRMEQFDGTGTVQGVVERFFVLVWEGVRELESPICYLPKFLCSVQLNDPESFILSNCFLTSCFIQRLEYTDLFFEFRFWENIVGATWV